MKAKEVRKAIVAGVTAALGALTVAATDGSFTMEEWITIAATTLMATELVHRVPNQPKPKPIVPEEEALPE